MKVKGSALRARLRWVKEQGETAWQAFLTDLRPSTRELAEQGVLPSLWYPFDAFVEVSEVIDRRHGGGDLELCYELGRYAADANLPTLYKLFFRFGNVHYIIDRAAAAWRVNYDEGEMKVVERGRDFVVLQIDGVPKPARAHCLSVKGWVVRAAELSGVEVRTEEIEETCRARGDDTCRLTVRWR